MTTLADFLLTFAPMGLAVAATWVLYRGLLVPRRDIESIERDLERERHMNHFARTVAHYSVPPHEGHEIVPVETGGEVVARLCVTCDKQLAP